MKEKGCFIYVPNDIRRKKIGKEPCEIDFAALSVK